MQFPHIPCAGKGEPVLLAPECKAGVASVHLLLLSKPLITQPGRSSSTHHHHHHFFPRDYLGVSGLPGEANLEVTYAYRNSTVPTDLRPVS